MSDTISREAAIDALWKALHEYEDKTEKQFQESEDLDVGDWIEHRIFVQNMNDIDRQTILNLPPAHPERIRARWVKQALGWKCSNCAACTNDFGEREFNFCPICGAEIMRCKEVRFWDAFPSSKAVLWRDDKEPRR